jgi:hypothetical protein
VIRVHRDRPVRLAKKDHGAWKVLRDLPALKVHKV